MPADFDAFFTLAYIAEDRDRKTNFGRTLVIAACGTICATIDQLTDHTSRKSTSTFFNLGDMNMGDKGSKDKGKREQQKKAKLNPKEKRKAKNEKKNKSSWFALVPSDDRQTEFWVIHPP